MFITDPAARPSSATMANGTRNHVGSRLASAPIGSAPIAWFSGDDEPASSRPDASRSTGATDPANVVHHTTPSPDDRLGRYRE